MKLHVLHIILEILRREGVRVEEVDAWDGWDEFIEAEAELEVRFDYWGETLQVRELCLECGQGSASCVCRSLYPYTFAPSR